MARATVSDSVLDGSGKPVVGALVTLLRASDYSSPPTSDPGAGSANYIRQAYTGPGGSFQFSGVPVDDYHVMVQYQGRTVFRYYVAALPAEVADTKSTHNRVLVPRFVSKVLRGDSSVVHCVGDSVTVGYNSTGVVGANFVQRLGVLIGQQLAPRAAIHRYDPDSYGTLNDAAITGWQGPTVIQNPSAGSSQIIQMVNNGVSGDTIQRVLRRFGNLTGWTPVVDLFIIYLGINDSLANDSSKFVLPDDFAAGIRSLVEIVRNYYPNAELALMTPHANDQPDAGYAPNGIAAGQYTLDEYADATRRCCLETGTALIDLRQLWKDARDTANPALAGSDYYPATWLDNTGGNHTHPSDEGHQAIAEETFKSLFGAPGLAAGRDQRISTLGRRAHFKDLRVLRLDTNSPALVFGGGHWATDGGGGLGYLDYSAFMQKSDTAGDTLTFTMAFQDLDLLVTKYRNTGKISVAIDGGDPTTYDLYRPHPTNIADASDATAAYPMEKVRIASDLPEGVHTAVITVLGEHTDGSSGDWVYIDGVEFTQWRYTARQLECNIEGSKLLFGSFTCQITAAAFGTVAITYAVALHSGSTPAVVASTNQVDHYCTVDAVTSTGCNIRVVHRDGASETATVTGQFVVVG